jgi:alkanesulfonate monooxygenase SsuD/methylene tetrahydromethanopterin reductase-like flavin-dependent oxidoreductase (luciferase family)
MGIPYFRIEFFIKNYELFKEICEKEGYRAHPEQMGLLMPIYVGDSDAKARAEYEEHFWYFQRNLIPGLTLAPPGYTSVKSALRVFRALQDGKTFINSCATWDDVERGGFAVVGSAQTVAQKLIEWGKRIGCGNLLGLFQLGNMPKEKALANLRRYAEEVKPLIDKELPNTKEPMPAAVPFPKAA